MKDAKPPTGEEFTEFSRRAGINFPTSATPLRFWAERGMDDALYLKLTLPANAVPAFLAAPPFAGTTMSVLLDNSRTKALNAARVKAFEADNVFGYFSDWIPSRPQKFQFCEPSLPNARFMKCIFDFDDPATTTIYLMWHET